MQYILSQEELDNLVPKQELDETNELLDAVVKVFRNSKMCNKHMFKNTHCDDCPIASLNLETKCGERVCKDQSFSK